MKKYWISVKCGLSRDPKHRQAMGEAVWLFMHMLDTADWETGIVHDWRDKDVAAEMGMSERTVRDWRMRLVNGGYIKTAQRQYSMDVTIHNWTNPREYGGRRVNEKQGDIGMSPSEKEESQGDTQGDTQVPQIPLDERAPFIESKSKPHVNQEQDTNSQAFKYWQTIDEYLRSEMPRQLHKYLDGCVPLQWEGSTLTVQAQDAEWLDQHVGKLAKRFLVGMAQGGAVEFVA